MRSTYLPSDAAVLFSEYTGAWGVAGGWAIDLHVGKQTRPHEDLDIALLRRDQDAAHNLLAGWELFVAHEGTLTRWNSQEPLAADRHAVWCRPPRSDEWAFELLFNDTQCDEWLFRRDHGVRMPVSRAFKLGTAGIPFLAPEIVLLYKAKQKRESDEHDFAIALPGFATNTRKWLGAALKQVHPDHPWLGPISDAQPDLIGK